MRTEADRIAFYKHEQNAKDALAIADWLAANPSVGVLNGNKFYIIRDGEQVFVSPLQQIK